MLLKISLQFLSEFEALHLFEFFGRSEGMFDDVFAVIIGKRIVLFPSIGVFSIKVGVIKLIVYVDGFDCIILRDSVRDLKLLK
jgi:hypothetical protein